MLTHCEVYHICTASDELSGGIKSGTVWFSVAEISDECNSDGLAVVSTDLSTNSVPATTLVHVTVLSD